MTTETAAGAAPRTRADRMPPERRRAMIAEQAVPLFLEHGAALTTRRLAEEIGIAEGTIFRAFGDKDSLLRAAVEAFFAQGRARMTAGLVDPDLPLAEKVAVMVREIRAWSGRTMRMLSLVPREEMPRYLSGARDHAYRDAVAAAFAADADVLSIPPERLGQVLRLAVMAGGRGHPDHHDALTDDEIVGFILYGIAGAPRGKDRSCSADS